MGCSCRTTAGPSSPPKTPLVPADTQRTAGRLRVHRRPAAADHDRDRHQPAKPAGSAAAANKGRPRRVSPVSAPTGSNVYFSIRDVLVPQNKNGPVPRLLRCPHATAASPYAAARAVRSCRRVPRRRNSAPTHPSDRQRNRTRRTAATLPNRPKKKHKKNKKHKKQKHHKKHKRQDEGKKRGMPGITARGGKQLDAQHAAIDDRPSAGQPARLALLIRSRRWPSSPSLARAGAGARLRRFPDLQLQRHALRRPRPAGTRTSSPNLWVGNRYNQHIPPPSCDCQDPRDINVEMPPGVIGTRRPRRRCSAEDFANSRMPAGDPGWSAIHRHQRRTAGDLGFRADRDLQPRTAPGRGGPARVQLPVIALPGLPDDQLADRERLRPRRARRNTSPTCCRSPVHRREHLGRAGVAGERRRTAPDRLGLLLRTANPPPTPSNALANVRSSDNPTTCDQQNLAAHLTVTSYDRGVTAGQQSDSRRPPAATS